MLLTIFLLLLARTDAANQRIVLVFRYDDFSNYSSSPLETAVLELFKMHNLPVTIGVTPFSVPNATSGGADRGHRLTLMLKEFTSFRRGSAQESPLSTNGGSAATCSYEGHAFENFMEGL